MALAPGTQLGQYQILTPIGAGGMGEVYRARDTQLGREVAIKVLPATFSRDPDRLRRFEQEARAAAALNHPNVLAVYQFGTYDGSPYLVSELLEGSNLRDQLMRGPLPVRKAVDYAMQTARGLAAAHDKGIVHRDLKPENLFLTKDGRIKILDFGLAKLIATPQVPDSGAPTVGDPTDPGMVLGTVGYMSPKQVRGTTTDHRTDLFSLGAMLYEMLTGKRAFHKPTSAETMSAILNEETPPVSAVTPNTPPGLLKVVQRCLEKNPEQRFHSASDLAFALEALSESGTAPTGAFIGQRAQSKVWWLGGALAVLLVVVAIAVWLARPPAMPVVESVVQLTNDGKSKVGSLEADASRIYFNEGPVGSFRIAQVSVGGGQTGEITTNVLNPDIAGLTHDGATLLVLSGGFIPEHETMWLLPLPAGEARRIGSDVRRASMFPDGRILYRTDEGIFIAGKDAADSHQLTGFPKEGRTPQISRDARRMVFISDEKDSWSIRESELNGGGAHVVLTQNAGLPDDICCPRWSEDESYIIFRGYSGGRWDLWAIPDRRSWFARAPAPIRLTNGPLSYSAFTSSRDGKQIFAVGYLMRGEMLRYDLTAHNFLPYLGGISANDPTFSRDGQWVSYISYPERTLWRSRTDGSERLQLTYAPISVGFERISPDGSQVAFSDGHADIFVVSINGGPVRKLGQKGTAPDWSPDGKTVAVTGFVGNAFTSRLVDVATGTVSEIPGALGTLGPWYAGPDALIAASGEQSKFSRYEFKTQKWTEIISSPDKFVNWETSPDNKYFVYSIGGKDPTVFRMRLSDGVTEKLVSLKDVNTGDDPETDPSLSVAPDNSVIIMRNIGTQEIYALTVKWP